MDTQAREADHGEKTTSIDLTFWTDGIERR